MFSKGGRESRAERRRAVAYSRSGHSFGTAPVFLPGGLGSAQRFEKVNFTIAVIKSLERKVQYMKHYRRNFDNVELAAL